MFWYIFACGHHTDSWEPDREAAVRDQREQASPSRFDNTKHFILVVVVFDYVIHPFVVFDRRLLEKSQRIEAILASLQATGAETTQLTEVEEMITAPERQQLESLRHHINKYYKDQLLSTHGSELCDSCSANH